MGLRVSKLSFTVIVDDGLRVSKLIDTNLFEDVRLLQTGLFIFM